MVHYANIIIILKSIKHIYDICIDRTVGCFFYLYHIILFSLNVLFFIITTRGLIDVYVKKKVTHNIINIERVGPLKKVGKIL